MKNKAQSVLEFAVTFTIMAFLLFALLVIWRDYCKRIIDNRKAYAAGRAGSASYGVPATLAGGYVPGKFGLCP